MIDDFIIPIIIAVVMTSTAGFILCLLDALGIQL